MSLSVSSVTRQYLQRHVPIQLGVSRSIHLTHAPLADEGGDVIVAESGADFESHGLLWIYGRSSRAFYAQAVNGSTVMRRMSPSQCVRTHSPGLQQPRGWSDLLGRAQVYQGAGKLTDPQRAEQAPKFSRQGPAERSAHGWVGHTRPAWPARLPAWRVWPHATSASMYAIASLTRCIGSASATRRRVTRWHLVEEAPHAAGLAGGDVCLLRSGRGCR